MICISLKLFHEPDNLSRMLFQLFLMHQIHHMHPLKSKRKVLTDRRPIQETGPAVMVINIYKY